MPVYEHYSDEQLAAASRDEDLGAWEAFMRRHGQRLFAFTARMTGDGELARELWVRVFSQAWSRRGAAAGAKATTSVFSLAVSLCSEATAAPTHRAPRGDASSLELRSARLSQCLLELPFRARAALCLCYFDNVGFEEAERCLGVGSGEARRLCAEGYAALARSLGPGFLREGLE